MTPEQWNRELEDVRRASQRRVRIWKQHAVYEGGILETIWQASPLVYWKLGAGAVWESVWKRFRRCVICGRWFARQGWWNPFCGVNIFEEHCCKECADEDGTFDAHMPPF